MTQAPVAPAPGFASDIQALLDLQPGARFIKADLQVHTPADPRFPGEEPKDANARRALAREYLEAARQRGIEVVGVTEHNDVSWVDDLRYAANGRREVTALDVGR